MRARATSPTRTLTSPTGIAAKNQMTVMPRTTPATPSTHATRGSGAFGAIVAAASAGSGVAGAPRPGAVAPGNSVVASGATSCACTWVTRAIPSARYIGGPGTALETGRGAPEPRRTGATLGGGETGHEAVGLDRGHPRSGRFGVRPPADLGGRVEEEVRDRVRGVGPEPNRGRVVRHEQDPVVTELRQRGDERADDLAIPGLERGDLLPRVLLVAGFVGRLDVEEEEVAIRQARQARVALRAVVVVEAGT